MRLGRYIAAGVVAAAGLTAYTLGQTEVARFEAVGLSHTGAGALQSNGGIQVNGQQVVNANGTIPGGRLTTDGAVPEAALPSTFSSAKTFAANVTQSAGHRVDTSTTSLSIASTNATINPGTASVAFITPTGPGQSIATIQGGFEGRILHVCVAGDAITFKAGGNIVMDSGGLSYGGCSTLIYHSNQWWYFD